MDLPTIESVTRMILRHLSLILALAAGFSAAPGLCAYTESGDSARASETQGQAKIKLQGHAEVQQFQRDMQAWQASQLYRQGAYLMAVSDFNSAADCFNQAGDGFDSALGPSKFEAEARYAEAQCRRLLKQNAKAVALFQIAVDMFQEYDPRNPYLKAGRGYLDQMNGSKPPLKAKSPRRYWREKVSEEKQQKMELHFLQPHNDFIDNRVSLKGNVTELACRG